MLKMIKKPIEEMGLNFIPDEFLPVGKDEYFLRNNNIQDLDRFRKLHADEIEVLVKNGNVADDWGNIHVTEFFNPKLVKRCKFHGLVRIGKLENYYLEYHDLKVSVGLYDSTIVACDFGDNVSINKVSYLAHYQIQDEVILFNIKEMITTSVAKFGNGILRDGESESSRIEIELGNENGGRSVLPFNGILPSDIALWYKYKGDQELQKKFREFTLNKYDTYRGHYGIVGSGSIVKNCSIIKDVKFGESVYIKGCLLYTSPSPRDA